MSQVTLDLLPTEILLHICDFLNARFVAEILSCVCKRFNELLEDQFTWKARIQNKRPGKYPPIPSLAATLDWRKVCILREEKYDLWGNAGHPTLDFRSFPHVHNGDIHALHIIPEHPSILASASRDRGFCLWNLNNWPDNQENMLINNKTIVHDAWIWCLTSADSQLFTGSFDGTIKSWNLETVELVNTFKCDAAVLSVVNHENQLFGGTIGCLNMFDKRSLNRRRWKNYHKAYIFGLVADDYCLISASKDHTVKALDLRTNKVFFSHKFENYPTGLSYGHGQVWIGDQGGNIHLIDPKNWKYVLEIPNVARGLVRAQHSLSSIVTYHDRNISILEPTVEGSPIRQFSTKGVVGAIASYKNQLLVANMELITVVTPSSENDECIGAPLSENEESIGASSASQAC